MKLSDKKICQIKTQDYFRADTFFQPNDLNYDNKIWCCVRNYILKKLVFNACLLRIFNASVEYESFKNFLRMKRCCICLLWLVLSTFWHNAVKNFVKNFIFGKRNNKFKTEKVETQRVQFLNTKYFDESSSHLSHSSK